MRRFLLNPQPVLYKLRNFLNLPVFVPVFPQLPQRFQPQRQITFSSSEKHKNRTSDLEEKHKENETAKSRQIEPRSQLFFSEKREEDLITGRGVGGSKVVLIERGIVYFFFRPKQGSKKLTGLEDVESFSFALHPGGISGVYRTSIEHPGSKARLITMVDKKLPETRGHPHEHFWGYVEAVANDFQELATENLKDKNGTVTRVIGRGIYSILLFQGHSHFAYVLELPEELGEIHKSFRIQKEGSFGVSVRNPLVQQTEYPFELRDRPKPQYPKSLQETFKGNWNSVNPDFPDYLDHKGTSLMFIGNSSNLKKNLGNVGEVLEEISHQDLKHLEEDNTIFEELKGFLNSKNDEQALPLFGESHWDKKE